MLIHYKAYANLQDFAMKVHRDKGTASKIVIKWFRNNALDPAQNWQGLVIRGLPDSCCVQNVKSIIKCTPLRIEQPQTINGIMCCIVVVKSIDKAENICFRHQKTKSGVKIDLHPHCQIWHRTRDDITKKINRLERKKKVKNVKNRGIDDIFNEIFQEKEQPAFKKLIKNPFEGLIGNK